MAKPKAKPRNRVKGVASRGRRRQWKWILILLVILLLIPAMQVAAVRFVDPPGTVPMCRVKGFTSTRLRVRVAWSGTEGPLQYRWIPLGQM